MMYACTNEMSVNVGCMYYYYACSLFGVRTAYIARSVLCTDLWLMLMTDTMHSFYVVKWYEFCMVNVGMYITLSNLNLSLVLQVFF